LTRWWTKRCAQTPINRAQTGETPECLSTAKGKSRHAWPWLGERAVAADGLNVRDRFDDRHVAQRGRAVGRDGQQRQDQQGRAHPAQCSEPKRAENAWGTTKWALSTCSASYTKHIAYVGTTTRRRRAARTEPNLVEPKSAGCSVFWSAIHMP
jgi:hypothetical protein